MHESKLPLPLSLHLGYLQLTFTDPTPAQTGDYTCEVNAVNKAGHVITSSSDLEVTSATPTMADLVTYVREMNREKQQMIQTISELQHKLDTKVFFSVALTQDVTLPARGVLVFDKILQNVGGGYSASSGAFTCPVDGYYLFEMHALSENNKEFALELFHNSQCVVRFYGPGGNSHQGASQSTVLKLVKGDTVNLRGCYVVSTVYGRPNDIHSTFTGLLVAFP